MAQVWYPKAPGWSGRFAPCLQSPLVFPLGNSLITACNQDRPTWALCVTADGFGTAAALSSKCVGFRGELKNAVRSVGSGPLVFNPIEVCF